MNIRAKSPTEVPSVDIHTMLAGIAARADRDLGREATRLKLTVPGLRLLALLDRREPLRCSIISEALAIDAPTLSHLMKSLTKRDLIARERSRDDNRAVEVRLTPDGAALARQCRDLEVRARDTLLGGVTESEKRALEAMFSRMADNLSRARNKKLARGKAESTSAPISRLDGASPRPGK